MLNEAYNVGTYTTKSYRGKKSVIKGKSKNLRFISLLRHKLCMITKPLGIRL